jgi:hypothetical protein
MSLALACRRRRSPKLAHGAARAEPGAAVDGHSSNAVGAVNIAEIHRRSSPWAATGEGETETRTAARLGRLIKVCSEQCCSPIRSRSIRTGQRRRGGADVATNLCSFSDQVVPDRQWLSKKYTCRLVDFARLKSNEVRR